MPERKNVLFLVLDSLRRDKISVYNEDVDFTPNFKEIAENSTVYTQANAQAPWTLPSTATIFTGKYPWEHGATHKKIYLDNNERTLAEKFQEKDYITQAISPNTWISQSVGTVDGFDQVDNLIGLAGLAPFQKLSGKITELFTYLPEFVSQKITYTLDLFLEKFVDVCKSRDTVSSTKKFLKEIDEDDDFFLFVNLMSAHEPYEIGDPPEEYINKHDVNAIEQVPDTEREYFHTDYDKENMEKAYNAAVDYTDDLVGEINESLKRNNLFDDTIVVIASDHGQAVGKDGVYGHQFTLMDRVVDTPLIISDPETGSEQKSHLFELRQLYKLIPYLADIEDSKPRRLAEVKGGYEFPESFAGVIPDNLRDKFDRKLRYIKTEDRKIIKSESRSGETDYKITNRSGSQKVHEDADLKKRVDNIEEVSSTEPEDNKIEDEEVKSRLEDLGYM